MAYWVDQRLTRRRLLVGLGAAGLMLACDLSAPPIPAVSPVNRGRYGVRRAILGVTPGTSGMPLPATTEQPLTHTLACPGGISESIVPPAAVTAMIYYPSVSQSYSPTVPIQLNGTSRDTFPVAFYAHARRLLYCPLSGLDPKLVDISRDYTHVDFMLDHVASYGCVIVVPDLSWLSSATLIDRSTVLVAMYQHLQSMNPTVFANRLDLSRILLMGHSTGGGSCLVARRDLVLAGGPRPVAVGLLAPAADDASIGLAAQATPLLVLKGMADTQQHGVVPDAVYGAAGTPKTLVTVEGANHFGYTDLCSADNQHCAAEDSAGGISTLAQQLVGASYLSALVRRFALGDQTAQPYLQGHPIEGLDTFGAKGIQVTQAGM